MRLRLNLEFDWEEKHSMADWIDDLKRKRDEEEKRADERAEANRRKREIIAAKLSPFLIETAARVRSDIARLRETFPNDARFDLRLSGEAPHFALASLGPVSIRLSLQGEGDELRAYVVRSDLNRSDLAETIRMPLSLDTNDLLNITFGQQNHYRAEDLAETLVRFVAGVK